MTAFHAWRLTDSELLQVRLLDWAYEDEQEHPGGSHTVHAFHQSGVFHAIDVQQAVKTLQSRGMVEIDKRGHSGEARFHLMPAGIADVEARGLRRDDPGLRQQSCRDAFLFWLSTQPFDPLTGLPTTARFLTSKVCLHEGKTLEQGDLDEATDYLYAWVLIDGITSAGSTGLVQARMLPAGWDCLDSGGSVAAWTKRHSASADPKVTSIGTSHAQSAAIRSDQTHYLRIEMASLRELLNAIRDDSKQLDADTARDVRTYTDALWAEASTRSPDPVKVEHRAQRLDQITSTAAGAPARSSVNRLMDWLLPQLG